MLPSFFLGAAKIVLKVSGTCQCIFVFFGALALFVDFLFQRDHTCHKQIIDMRLRVHTMDFSDMQPLSLGKSERLCLNLRVLSNI